MRNRETVDETCCYCRSAWDGMGRSVVEDAQQKQLIDVQAMGYPAYLGCKRPPGANVRARAIPISFPLLQHDRSNTIATRVRRNNIAYHTSPRFTFLPCTAIKFRVNSTQEPCPIAIRQSTALSAGTCASPGRVGFPFDSSIAAVPRLLANFSLSTPSCWSWDVNDQSPVFVAGIGRSEARAMVLAFDQNSSSVHSARSFQCEPSVIRLLVMAERQATTQHNRVPAVRSGCRSPWRSFTQTGHPNRAFASFRCGNGLALVQHCGIGLRCPPACFSWFRRSISAMHAVQTKEVR
ncbi:hypothetical protein BDP55DRAFT_678510 [Colletotrichum godetiae]|uniref:Uncharacterized protein n=1 Tax=Colletotrichum godetiae TaxID=1209918 RepID=A0AAJ0AAZ1_9PEZI|nr:uncharacterized protein BDP55DRAFT_678510 [Colletotrichum godetiae]KAK1659810.1 hypothetical protein BDP55DRAFT_678510 [Colletotrichum godetiae]